MIGKKRGWSTLFFAMALMAQTQISMPPMVPSMGNHASMTDHGTKKVVGYDACAEVPPMLIMLPPPLEEARSRCVRQRYWPSKAFVMKKLKEKLAHDLEILSIQGVEGFDKLYRIEVKIGQSIRNFWCDAHVAHCFEGERRW